MIGPCSFFYKKSTRPSLNMAIWQGKEKQHAAALHCVLAVLYRGVCLLLVYLIPERDITKQPISHYLAKLCKVFHLFSYLLLPACGTLL